MSECTKSVVSTEKNASAPPYTLIDTTEVILEPIEVFAVEENYDNETNPSINHLSNVGVQESNQLRSKLISKSQRDGDILQREEDQTSLHSGNSGLAISHDINHKISSANHQLFDDNDLAIHNSTVEAKPINVYNFTHSTSNQPETSEYVIHDYKSMYEDSNSKEYTPKEYKSAYDKS